MKYTMEDMKLRELDETLELVKKVFDEFEAPDYSLEGIESFNKFVNSVEEQLNKNMKIFVAKDNNKIIGMVAFRDYSHISMLFVDKMYHRQGIATELVEIVKLQCGKYNENVRCITVNSSPYAIEFYHKVGFENITPEQVIDGIRFTPMKMYI